MSYSKERAVDLALLDKILLEISLYSNRRENGLPLSGELKDFSEMFGFEKDPVREEFIKARELLATLEDPSNERNSVIDAKVDALRKLERKYGHLDYLVSLKIKEIMS